MIEIYHGHHCHSEFSNALLSFPDVVARLPELIQYAYDSGLSGITITEHEGISSHIKAVEYYNSMQKDRPFKLGLGNEIYLMEENEDLENREHWNTYPYYHFILIALDTEGHHQLRQLSTRAWKRSWKQGKNRRRATYYTDLEEIVKPNQGHIVASTACLGSRLDKLLLANDIDGADREVERLINIFGKDNFYIECQPAKEKATDQSKVNNLLKQTAEYHKVPMICTTDVHYLRKEDAIIHKTYLKSEDKGEREVDAFYATAYLMSPNELREHLRIDFSDDEIDNMFVRTNEISDRIKEYNLFHDPIIPQIPVEHIPKNFKIKNTFKEYYEKYPTFGYYASSERILHEKYFFYQIEQGLIDKVLNQGEDIDKYIARLEEEWIELKIISEQLNTSMASYYSTMSQIIELIWEAGSLAMPARGSAAGFLTCYLLEITQINPVPLGEYFPSWRHLNHQRKAELPDIDNDSEASKKVAIVNKMKEYFGEDRVLNVANFQKISSKIAIEKACKGLKKIAEENGENTAPYSEDTANYLKSLIPVNRGKVSSLYDAIYGNKSKGVQAVSGLKAEFEKSPDLLESAMGLEGLINNRGCHAAGVLVMNSPYTDYISAMTTADGVLESCYDLWDAEKASCIKFDMLTTICADKIHKTMDFLLDYGKIKWQGSLKETYYKYLHPDVIEYKEAKMWEILPTIYSVFQFDTPISQKALSATRPQSAMGLSAANSLLRLMPEGGGEAPIDKYKRYKESHEAWIQDTKNFGLNDEERICLWEYLGDAYGLADSQEKIMRLSQDARVAGYTLSEANKLNKAIKAKDEVLQEQARKQFFEYGQKLGTREVFLDYVWNVVFSPSFGYSFSQLHSYSYSIIALQELNLNYFYSRVYWNCACLSIEATGITDEGEDRTKSSSTDYGEVAKAIYKMKKYGVEVQPPSANESNLDFTPIEKTNSILFGIGGIAGINTDIATQIIANRPYADFKDFYRKNSYPDSFIKNQHFIQLIKAGCFDEFNPDRVKVMKQYVVLSTETKDKLTMQNLDSILKLRCPLPKPLSQPIKFKKYVCSKRFYFGQHPNFKTKKLYWLDQTAMRYFVPNCQPLMQEGVDYWEEEGRMVVVDKSLEKMLKPTMENLKGYINTPEFIKEYNKCLYRTKYQDMIEVEDVNKWSFEALSYYSLEHELAHVDFDRYNISHFADLPEEPQFIERSWGKRTWKQYDISAICGTILAKSDNNHLVTILTQDDEVVNCKLNAGQFAHYKAQLSEIGEDGKKTIVEKPWISRGQLVIMCGYRRGDDFVCKKYSNSVFQHTMMKIEKVYEDGSLDIISERYNEEDE